MKHFARTISLLIVVALANSAFAQGRDVIEFNDGEPRVSGKIGAISKNEVAIETKGGTEKIPANRIESISFNGEPSAMKQARSLIDSGQYDEALERLTKVDTKRKNMAGEVAFYRAYAIAKKGGEPSKAVKALLDFVKKNRNSHHFYKSVELLGDLAMQLGNYSRAASYYAQLGKSPWPSYKLKGDFLAATALQAQGPSKAASAVRAYDAVIKGRGNSAEAARYKQLAQVGKVACSVNKSNWSKSVKQMQQLIAKNDPKDAELFARTYNALGACYEAGGKTQDAVHQYLHVALLFDRVDTAHAEALYHLSSLYPKLGNTQRAAEFRKQLTTRYAGTVWAKR